MGMPPSVPSMPPRSLVLLSFSADSLCREFASAAGRCGFLSRVVRVEDHMRLPADPDCPVCAAEREFPGYIDYVKFCAA